MPFPGALSTFGNSLAVTVASTNTATALPLGVKQNVTQLRVFNNSNGLIAITPGASLATAVAVFPVSGTNANGYVIAAGEDCIVTIPPQAGYIGVIGASGATGTVYFTQGEGI